MSFLTKEILNSAVLASVIVKSTDAPIALVLSPLSILCHSLVIIPSFISPSLSFTPYRPLSILPLFHFLWRPFRALGHSNRPVQNQSHSNIEDNIHPKKPEVAPSIVV